MAKVQQSVTFSDGEVIVIQYDSENPLSEKELISRAEEKRTLQKSFSPAKIAPTPEPEPEPEPQRENFVADMGQTMVRTMIGPLELGQDLINYAAKHPFGKAGEIASGLFDIPEGFTTEDVVTDDNIQNIKNYLVQQTTRGLQAYGQDVKEEEIIDKSSGKYKDYSTTAGALTLTVPYIVGGGALMRSRQAFKEGTSRLKQTLSNIASGGTAAVIVENALYSDNPSETIADVALNFDELGVIQMNQQTKDFVEFFHIKEDDDELEKRMRLSLEALAANNLVGAALEGIRLTFKGVNASKNFIAERIRPDMSVKEQADEAMAMLKEAKEEVNLAQLNATDYIPLSETPQGLAQVEMQNSRFINRFLGKWFTSRGYFTPAGFNMYRQKEYASRQIIQEAENIATRLSNKLDVLGDKRPTNKEVQRYLTEDFDFDVNAERQFKVNKVSNRLGVDAETAEIVLDARGLIDGLSSRIVNSSIPDGTLKEVIVENAGQYIRRSYRMFEDPNYKPSQSSMNRFIRQIQDGLMKPLYIKDPATGETVLSREALSEQDAFVMANSAVKSLMKDIKDSRGDVFSFFHNMSSENKSLLLQRQNLTKVTKEFLGEIENPSENVILTATKMARLVENNRFNERLLQAAGGKYLFPAQVKDAKGNVISGGPRVITSKRTGREINYTAKLNLPGSSLDGMFTTEQVKQALEGLQDDMFAGSLTTTSNIYKAIGQAAKAFSGLKGASQASKTVYSVTTTMRNFWGAPQFALANGVFSLGFKGGLTSVKSIANEAFNIGDEAFDELYEHYLKLGIINTNVKIGEFRRSLKDFEQTTSFADFMGRQAERAILKLPQDVYMGIDDFFKIGVYNAELETLTKAFPDEPVEVLERKAAQLVRNNMPNYDLVPPNIKNLRYLPFGNFPAFPSEIIRTSVNIVKQGYEEINSGNPVLERRGIKRLLGFAAIPALWEGLSTTSEYLMGYNDEEARAAQKLSETPWSKSNKIFMVVDGQTVAIDPKFIDSYNTIREPIQAVLGEIINGEMKEKELDEILMNAGVAAIEPLIAPYTDESIAAGALVDVARTVWERWLSQEEGRYVTDRGVEMTSPVMTNGEVLGEMAINLLDSVTPGLVTSAQNIFSDEKKTNFDRPRKDKNLELIALSGIRMTPVYADEAVFYAAEKYKRQQGRLGRKSPSFKEGGKSEEYLDRYARQLTLDYQYQQDLYEVVSSARSSIGDVAVENMLLKANLGDELRTALFKNRAHFSNFISENYREIGRKLGLDDQEEYANFMDRMNGIEDGLLRTPLIRVDEKKMSPREGKLDLPQLDELQGFAKGGEVTDVPQVPVEPDERIDKMTGRPYNEQAGEAFIDEEDRMGFVAGGSAIARKIAKFLAEDVAEEAAPKAKPVLQRSKGEPLSDDTLRPYEEVPEPATYDEMFNALRKGQKEKINIEVPDGQRVGLRLDINAYTNHDTWVPTLHVEPKGTSSHRATASIRNVDLMPTLRHEEKSKKVMEGGIKTPYARIGGNLITRTDEENYRLAQKALNDPEWTQVGFNPDRHSYFFDRATGDPIIGGEEAIQVGPLVLVKNAVRGERKDFMYNQGGLYGSISGLMEKAAREFFGVSTKDLRANEREAAELVNSLVAAGKLPEREKVTYEDGRTLSGDVFNAANHMFLANIAKDSEVKRLALQGKEYVQQATGDTGPHGAIGDRKNNSLGFELYDMAKGNPKIFRQLVSENLIDRFGQAEGGLTRRFALQAGGATNPFQFTNTRKNQVPLGEKYNENGERLYYWVPSLEGTSTFKSTGTDDDRYRRLFGNESRGGYYTEAQIREAFDADKGMTTLSSQVDWDNYWGYLTERQDLIDAGELDTGLDAFIDGRQTKMQFIEDAGGLKGLGGVKEGGQGLRSMQTDAYRAAYADIVFGDAQQALMEKYGIPQTHMLDDGSLYEFNGSSFTKTYQPDEQSFGEKLVDSAVGAVINAALPFPFDTAVNKYRPEIGTSSNQQTPDLDADIRPEPFTPSVQPTEPDSTDIKPAPTKPNKPFPNLENIISGAGSTPATQQQITPKGTLPSSQDRPMERRTQRSKGGKVDKKKMKCNKPKRTPNHPKKSHVVKACKDGKEKIIRFGEQGAKTAGKPKAGESKRMKAKRKSFKARHGRNIKKGNMSAAYWADKVKW